MWVILSVCVVSDDPEVCSHWALSVTDTAPGFPTTYEHNMRWVLSVFIIKAQVLFELSIDLMSDVSGDNSD